MIKGSHNESDQRKEKARKKIARKNGGTGFGSRTSRTKRRVSARKYCTGADVPMEAKVSTGRYCGPQRPKARSKTKSRSSSGKASSRNRTPQGSPSRDSHRAAGIKKKRLLGLEGPLYNRHLTKAHREALVEFIDKARKSEPLSAVCKYLQLNPRAYYRWKQDPAKENHGGGGGKNKITPLEEKRVVALAKKRPDWHCRRIAYHLEKTAKAFVGKTKVAEIMKSHGLNHPFVQEKPKPVIPPADMLLHEPWQKNLLWGMDWTWVTVNGKFMFCLVLLDWYSRKILSWGLYHQITQIQVVTVVTEAIAIEKIDLLPSGHLKPFVVADHGSANIAAYTKTNIEVQGLKLWLSGIGRPTGNARTERVIGTLKREEINLQEQYADETEARDLIGKAINDYNFNRPNQGNGGFAPNSVHHQGRYELLKRRERARHKAQELRRKHWEQATTSSTESLT